MIPLRDQEMIRAKFAAELVAQVKIDLFTERDVDLTVPGKRPCAFCKETGELLHELSGLSDLISLRVHYVEDRPPEQASYEVERVPTIVLRGKVQRGPDGAWEDVWVKYNGIPGGTEFPAFLECVIDLSRGESLLSEDSVAALSQLESDVNVKVFVTPTCPYCPAMMRAAYQASMVSSRVRAEAIEVNEFPELAEQYNVRAVPLTVINDGNAIPGMVPEAEFVKLIVDAAAAGEPAARAPIERGKERPSGLYIP